MRPVFQDVRPQTDPPTGYCFMACLASLLEVDPTEVPVLQGEEWTDQVNTYLSRYGLQLVGYRQVAEAVFPIGYHIVSGPAAADPDAVGGHAVVALGNDVIHDPNVQSGGLLSYDYRWFLVPADPAIRPREEKGPSQSDALLAVMTLVIFLTVVITGMLVFRALVVGH